MTKRTADTIRIPSRGEHGHRERALTQSQPARVGQTADALVLKDGDHFLLCGESGDVPMRGRHGLGLYWRDCRFLSGYELTMQGLPPVPLSSTAARGYETLHDLASPDLPAKGRRRAILKNTVAIRRQRIFHDGVLYELNWIRNYNRVPVTFDLELRWRSGFEDIFVLRGLAAKGGGSVRPARLSGPDVVVLRADGSDGARRRTQLAFAPAPTELHRDRARFRIALAPGAETDVAVAVTLSIADRDPRLIAPRRVQHDRLHAAFERSHRKWLAGMTTIRTSNELLNAVLDRSFRDLKLLETKLDGRRFFAAGVPWFTTLFGRDAAIVGLQLLPYDTAVALETLRLLARYQARTTDAFREAEPGKILHELRVGELARTGSIPQSPAYYGTVDATLLFVVLLAEYVRWSGDHGLASALEPNLDAAIDWATGYADHDGDGFLDYSGEYPGGLVNQGWKDSGNAIVNRDGTLVRPPVAPCEVQSYAYRALMAGAWLYAALGRDSDAAALRARARTLRAKFERSFWSEQLDCYALALERGGRRAMVASSNAGQVLWGGIASHAHARRVARRLMRPDLFSGWGIRTLSANAKAYNPLGYHIGSVWPHDNAMIISGLRAYGRDAEALTLASALFDAAAGFRDYRLPELFCGYARDPGGEPPVSYPVACSPQAWAAGAMPDVITSLLGLRADACARTVRVDPVLPPWIDWIELDGLRLGTGTVDLRVERRSDGTIRHRSRSEQISVVRGDGEHSGAR
jgi:glycogen debranching enzyme